jgi:NADP-dependent 3-hydroxy acid dehydrogenase YdfG
MTRLNGKAAVITGGATASASPRQRFIEEGAFVFIFGRRQGALDAAGRPRTQCPRGEGLGLRSDRPRPTLDGGLAQL